jgi:hypothetical protein
VALVGMLCIALLPLPAHAQASSGNDEGYTKKIREYTTEPYFLSDLVDHLPASATVPTPEKILGHIAGAPDYLTYSKDLYHYYDELAKATPRVKVFRVGKSEEGRDFVLVAVSDESNIAQLDRIKEITAKLSDPRKITAAEAQQLESTGKAIYWASASIHSPETGSPEMLMELAYRIAVENTPMIQNIRKNVVFLITPVVEVDGHDRMVDSWHYKQANPDKPQPSLVYWGHYVQHDNNRDAIAMGLKLSQVMMQNFLNWHPQILHDLHEAIPYLYISTGTGPYNAWLDPIVTNEWQKLAFNEVQGLTERGMVGVWTHGFYDGWACNYMFYVANGHNSIGRFYETFGHATPDTHVDKLGASATSRSWFRPNPPLPKVMWSMRNNTNLQESGLILGLDYMAQHRQEMLHDFYEKSRRSIAKATTEGPAAWAIVNDGRRPALAAQLAELMQQQGAEVQVLSQEFEVKPETPKTPPKTDTASDKKDDSTAKKEEPKPTKIPAGSYILRMDQPYSRMVDMLLDTQYYSTNDPTPYDDTGWTLGPLRNVKTVRVTDTGILKASMTMVKGPARFEGGGINNGSSSAKFYVINASAEPNLATLRFRLKDVKFLAAEDAFEAAGQKFVTGSFLIPADGNPSDLGSRLGASARELGIRVAAVDSVPDVRRHEIRVPRIAILHTWTDTQDEGWFRMAFDRVEVPYAYISDIKVRDNPNLRDQFDVIVFPPTFGGASTFLNGIPKRVNPDGTDTGAIPWQSTSVTPNLGGVDEAADIRGGFGLSGIANLKKFVDEGGVFVPITESTRLPIDFGFIEGVGITETHQLHAQGSVLRATVEDKSSPITYGYDDPLGVYFRQEPVFRVSVGGGGGGEGGGARPSGRGSLTDPDIPQGREWTTPDPPVHRSKAEQEMYVDPDMKATRGPNLLPPALYPRVVLRFAPDKDLWISGMLAGSSEMAEAPAVIDVPVGHGHVVLFANNPMWRQETQGSFMLLLNTALNFDHLDVGRKYTADSAK